MMPQAQPLSHPTKHPRLPVLDETGFVLLRDYEGELNPAEWEAMEYMDWKSGGDTNFAPIASALGDMECAGFWDHGKSDKDGVWTKNAEICPTLVKWAEHIGARFGRVRVIKLEPSISYEFAENCLHLDDNNRLNPESEPWVVRAWLNLTDDTNSYMIVRDGRDDLGSEKHIPLRKGAQFVVDTERLWHAVYHRGDKPRYALIVSFESAGDLQSWIDSQLP
ncbi:MAG TPA: hypothetical protein VFC19_47260 [Candidatus Limnocylindrales bacterium]|nr:hypothetical protein [Candidatus Limnocylindrales bacterium]